METIEKNILNQEDVNDTSTSSFISSLNSKIGLSNKPSNEATRRFYYTIGEFNILIEADLKVENLTELIINKVPNIPAWCSGIVSVRGVIMPVINMHNFLDTKKQNTANDNYMMLEHKDYAPIIFITDNLPSMVKLDKYSKRKHIENTPNWVKHRLSDGRTSIFDANHSQLLQHFTQN